MTALSALVVVHNEEAQLADCLERLGFAEILQFSAYHREPL